MERQAGGSHNSITDTALNRQTLFTLRISYSSLLATGIYLYTSQIPIPHRPAPAQSPLSYGGGWEDRGDGCRETQLSLQRRNPTSVSPCIVRPFLETC